MERKSTPADEAIKKYLAEKPPKFEDKNQPVAAQLPILEKQRLISYCQEKGITVSQLIRKLVHQELMGYTPKPQPSAPPAANAQQMQNLI